jgi:hypothetical protein
MRDLSHLAANQVRSGALLRRLAAERRRAQAWAATTWLLVALLLLSLAEHLR